MQRQNSRLFLLAFLGTLSAFGPFVMDMYLPTLPGMAHYFHTSPSMVQLGLTTSMAGLAAGQLLFGPLSDKYGRRPPLLAAMVLFLASTAGCIFAQDIAQFVALRFVQGVAGAGGVVISRSIAADRYSGHELAAMLAVIGAVNGVATVAAPMAGGILSNFSGWHGIFWFLFALGAALLACTLRLGEPLPSARRRHVGWADLRHGFGHVLRNRQYVCYILQYGFTMGVLFVNIASAPFIMQQHYGISPVRFSFYFGLNAVAMVISSAAAVRFPSMKRAMLFSSYGMVAFSLLLFAALYHGCSFWVYETLVFCLLSMVGMGYTASNALAMDCERKNAGIASALLGATGFAFGGIVPPLVGLGPTILVSTGTLFLLGSLCACMCARYAVLHSLAAAAYWVRKK